MAKTTERVLLPSPLGGGGTLIASPFQFAIDGADNLRLRLWFLNHGGTGLLPDVALLSFRTVGPDGTIQVTSRTLTPTNASIANTLTVALSRGFLQDLTVTWGASTPTFVGLAYVTVELIRGLPPGATTTMGQLLGGYIRPGGGLAWPGSPIVSSVEGRGLPYVLEGSLAGAGREAVITTPLLTRVQVRSVYAEFATSATVAGRVCALLVKSPTAAIQARCAVPAAIAASDLGRFTWLEGAAQAGFAGLNWQIVPLPAGVILAGTSTIETSTLSLQVDDNYTMLRASVEEWLEANV